jgi:hypothetical protein
VLGTVKNKPESLRERQRNFPLPALVIGTGQQQSLYGKMKGKHSSTLTNFSGVISHKPVSGQFSSSQRPVQNGSMSTSP